MSLWKLRVGVESYYLAQIASGLDEYYTGAGEAPGTMDRHRGRRCSVSTATSTATTCAPCSPASPRAPG